MSKTENRPLEESNEQFEVRRQKLAKLKAAGYAPYPNDFRPTHTIANAVAKFGDLSDEELSRAPQELRLAGRIMAIRKMGKASFFHVQDRWGTGKGAERREPRWSVIRNVLGWVD